MNDDYLRAIGRLTVAAGQIELDTFALTRLLIGGDFKVARAVASGMQFAQLANLAKNLASTSDSGLVDVLAWLSEARAFMGERNTILHATWVSHWPAPSDAQINAMHIKTMKGVHIALADIQAAAERGEDLHRRFLPVSFK